MHVPSPFRPCEPAARRSRLARAAVASVLASVAVAGCGLLGLLGARSPGAGPRRVSFHGWRRCWRLDNGLARVTIVPQVGGRPLEYAVAGANFLFIGRGELGATLGKGQAARYHHFGGYFARLHPEERWARLRSTPPFALFMRSYEARVAQGRAVELASPVDLASGTRIARRVELVPGSTRVRITDTLTNVRPVTQDWGIQATVQLKGVGEPSGVLDASQRPTGEITLYVPLNPRSRFPGGVRFIAGGARRSATSQWSTTELPGILTLRYRGRLGKATVDPALPWIAVADARSGLVFVQTCAVPAKAILSAGGALAPYPFVEIQCFGPVARLKPGESTQLAQEWQAARWPGPVVDVTAAGVVASPLKLLRRRETLWLDGTFGVFAVGRAVAVFRGPDGAELGRLDCGTVHPWRVFRLSRQASLPPRTARVGLEVWNTAGEALGTLGELAIATR